MTEKGFRVLEALIDRGFLKLVAQVIIGSDKNQQDFSVEIKELCIANGISYSTKKDFETLKKCDYGLAIGWRWMIKDSENLLVLHDSLLPKYRGFAPLVNALLNKEKTIGATAIWASNQYDTGDIIMKKKFEVSYPLKIKKAIDSMALCYVEMALEIFQMVLDGEEIPRTPQYDKNATYGLWRDEEDYHIDWGLSANAIRLLVDCLGEPYKGAYTIVGEKKVRNIRCGSFERCKDRTKTFWESTLFGRRAARGSMWIRTAENLYCAI